MPLNRPVPASPYAPAAAAPAPSDAREPPANLGLSLVVMAGGLLLAAGQVVMMTELGKNAEGSDLAMFLLAGIGSMVLGLGLLALGVWGTSRPGPRAAYLIAGAYLLVQGSVFAQLGGVFSSMFGFGRFN